MTHIVKAQADKAIDALNIRIYDNGGKTFDRYTVIFMDSPENKPGLYTCLGMSSNPFHPQGYGQHGIAHPGRHLGLRIRFEQLPTDCKRCLRRDLGYAQ